MCRQVYIAKMEVVLPPNRLVNTKCSTKERLLDLSSYQVISLYDFALCQLQEFGGELDPADLKVPTEILIDLYVVLIDTEPTNIEKLTPKLLLQMIKITHKRHEMYNLFQRIYDSEQWDYFLNFTYQSVCYQLRQNNVKVAYEMCVRVATFLSECGCYVDAIRYYELNLKDCKRAYETNKDPAVLEWLLLCATKLNTAYLEIYDVSNSKRMISLIRKYENFIADPNYNRSLIYLQYLKYYSFGKCDNKSWYWSRRLLAEINDSLNVRLLVEILRCVSTVYTNCGRVAESNLVILYAEELALTYDLSYLLYLRLAIDKIDSDVHVPQSADIDTREHGRAYYKYEAFLDETENVFGDECFKYAQAYHIFIRGYDKYIRDEPEGTQLNEVVKMFARHALKICKSYLPIGNALVRQLTIETLLLELEGFLNEVVLDETTLMLARQLRYRLWNQEIMYQRVFGDESTEIPVFLTLLAQIFHKIEDLDHAFQLYTESNAKLGATGSCLTEMMYDNYEGLQKIYEARLLYDLAQQAEHHCLAILLVLNWNKEDPDRSVAVYWLWFYRCFIMSVKDFQMLMVDPENAYSELYTHDIQH